MSTFTASTVRPDICIWTIEVTRKTCTGSVAGPPETRIVAIRGPSETASKQLQEDTGQINDDALTPGEGPGLADIAVDDREYEI